MPEKNVKGPLSDLRVVEFDGLGPTPFHSRELHQQARGATWDKTTPAESPPPVAVKLVREELGCEESGWASDRSVF